VNIECNLWLQWAGYLSRDSDWLRAGWSGDRIPVEARFSAPVQTGPGAHPASCTMGTGSFSGVESGRSVTLTPHSLLVPRSKKQSRAIPLLSLRVFEACRKGENYQLLATYNRPRAVIRVDGSNETLSVETGARDGNC
jgi:hypothetical protein